MSNEDIKNKNLLINKNLEKVIKLVKNPKSELKTFNDDGTLNSDIKGILEVVLMESVFLLVPKKE